MAGSYFEHHGSVGEYLCLPLQGTGNRQNARQGIRALIYMIEWEVGTDSAFPPSFQNRNAVCAQCERSGPSSTLMIAGRNTCMAGWQKLYSGWLMSERHNHSSKKSICVDADAVVAGTNANLNGGCVLWCDRRVIYHCFRLLYHVQIAQRSIEAPSNGVFGSTIEEANYLKNNGGLTFPDLACVVCFK